MRYIGAVPFRLLFTERLFRKFVIGVARMGIPKRYNRRKFKSSLLESWDESMVKAMTRIDERMEKDRMAIAEETLDLIKFRSDVEDVVTRAYPILTTRADIKLIMAIEANHVSEFIDKLRDADPFLLVKIATICPPFADLCPRQTIKDSIFCIGIRGLIRFPRFVSETAKDVFEHLVRTHPYVAVTCGAVDYIEVGLLSEIALLLSEDERYLIRNMKDHADGLIRRSHRDPMIHTLLNSK